MATSSPSSRSIPNPPVPISTQARPIPHGKDRKNTLAGFDSLSPLSPTAVALPIAATQIEYASSSSSSSESDGEEEEEEDHRQQEGEESHSSDNESVHLSESDSEASPRSGVSSALLPAATIMSQAPDTSTAQNTSPDSPNRRVSWHASADSSPTEVRKSSQPQVQIPETTAESAVESDGEADHNETTAILAQPNGDSTSSDAQNARRISNSVKNKGTDENGSRQYGTVRRRSTKTGNTGAQNQNPKPELPWWKRTIEKYGSVELENKGSVARDHLALERTFLAWLRTSLSFASIGIAVTQLFRLNVSLRGADPSVLQTGPGGQTPVIPPISDEDHDTSTMRLRHVGKPLGATFLAIGIVTLLIGFHRYFESQHYVIRGKFPASRGSVILVATMSGALIIASFVVVLTISPHSLAHASS